MAVEDERAQRALWWMGESGNYSQRMTLEIVKMEEEFELGRSVEYELPWTEWDVDKIMVATTRECERRMFTCSSYNPEARIPGWELYFKMFDGGHLEPEGQETEWRMWVLYHPDYLKSAYAPPAIVFPDYWRNDAMSAGHLNHVRGRHEIDGRVYPVACLYLPLQESRLFMDQVHHLSLAVNHAKTAIYWLRAHLGGDRMGKPMMPYYPEPEISNTWRLPQWHYDF